MERHQLSEEAAFKLQEGIQLLLSQWSSLQVAVENEFGGPDSLRKPNSYLLISFHGSLSQKVFIHKLIYDFFFILSMSVIFDRRVYKRSG